MKFILTFLLLIECIFPLPYCPDSSPDFNFNKGLSKNSNTYVHPNAKSREKACQVGLQASYLYWMIGSYTLYASVYNTSDSYFYTDSSSYNTSDSYFYTDSSSSEDTPPYILGMISDHQSDVIFGQAFASSGFRARASLASKKFDDWELGITAQWIEHKVDVLNGKKRDFTGNDWWFGLTYPAQYKGAYESLPLPRKNNHLIAKLSIGHQTAMTLTPTWSWDLGTYITFELDKIEQKNTFESITLDLTNYGFLFESNSVRLGIGFGIEMDKFNNSVEVRGGQTYITPWWDETKGCYCSSAATLDDEKAYYFAYRLENKPFCAGPFLQLSSELFFRKKSQSFALSGLLYGSGLYTQNHYKQFYVITNPLSAIFEDYVGQDHNWSTGTIVAPKSVFPSVCSIKLGAPDLCHDTKTSIYHAKVKLGLTYKLEVNRSILHAGIDWEMNSFLNLFDRDFVVFSHEDLNYQGLSATIGVLF